MISDQKRRRCYHRVISGIERGGALRFITLTSSRLSPAGSEGLQRSWRKLYMRLKRRGLLIDYIRVPEVGKGGMLHLHVIFRGSYIHQRLLSRYWEEIHTSPIVDIRAVRKDRLASYMAKYMSKEGCGHYSWSWGWVWKGFCRDWTVYKRYWWQFIYVEGVNDIRNLLVGWRMALHDALRLDFDAMASGLPTWVCIGA